MLRRVVLMAAFVAHLLGGVLSGQQPSYYADSIVPQMAIGGGWQTSIVLVNLSDKQNPFRVNFWTQAGFERQVSLEGMGVPVTYLQSTLPAGGSVTITTQALPGSNESSGWAEVNSAEVVGGVVIFSFSKPGIEKPEPVVATVPIGSRFASRFVVPFDNRCIETDGKGPASRFGTAVALVNPSFLVAANVEATFRTGSGMTIVTKNMRLGAGEQLAFVLPETYAELECRSGVAEFLTSNLELSGFALRFTPGLVDFASFPAMVPIGR